MIPLSVLDLCPVVEGGDVARAFRDSRELARHCERLGYRRFWLAEHHNMPGIASAATAVVIAHVAAGTSTIRVGAGGIMLPNHAPLQIAEQFGTLDALFPGRIDLALGRAPGTDQLTMRALRRTLASDPDQFPQDVVELMAFFRTPEPDQAIQAVPGADAKVALWILGSSLYGAQLAAMLGLPYGFASHFAPQYMMQAIEVYRERFEPSEVLQKPHVLLGYNVFAAETDAEAHYLASSMQQAFVSLRTGRPTRLPPPIANYVESLGPREKAILEQTMSCTAIGSPETVRAAINAFIARTGADELMVTAQMFDFKARLRSYEILASLR